VPSKKNSHSQCDLHTTTDVLLNPKLAKKCTKNFIPADKSESGSAEATCCTSDFTLEEIKSLCAKMDASNPLALTPEEYVIGATADWRTDLYSFECPQIVTHKESIELINSLGGKFTPELKTPSVEMPYEGDYTQEMFAQQMIDDYVEAGIDPSHVWPQSFLWDDIYYWIQNTEYGTQAVALDGCADVGCPETAEDLKAYFAPLVENEVNIIAPPQQVLVQPTKDGKGMEPSLYTETIKELGLDIITWTFERAGPLSNDPIGYYYSTIEDVVNGDGDSMELLHVLAQDVGILGIFSDWAAPVTFYANCMGLGLRDNEVSEKGN
jgi:glycerophosphoryl diester phosphodiesterase